MTLEVDIQSLQDADRILHQAMRQGGDRAILYSIHAPLADRAYELRKERNRRNARRLMELQS